MKKFRVRQHYEGSIIRSIKAKTKEEAEAAMWLDIEPAITFKELLDCNWSNPEAEEAEAVG